MKIVSPRTVSLKFHRVFNPDTIRKIDTPPVEFSVIGSGRAQIAASMVVAAVDLFGALPTALPWIHLLKTKEIEVYFRKMG